LTDTSRKQSHCEISTPAHLFFPVIEERAEYLHLLLIGDLTKISEVLFAYNGGDYNIRFIIIARLF
jgi:hypothetical protein